jgi:hypothetical protein
VAVEFPYATATFDMTHLTVESKESGVFNFLNSVGRTTEAG